MVTTDYMQQSAVLPGLPDGAKMLGLAFAAKPGAAPQVSSTGEGFAVFQVEDVKPAHAPAFEEYKAHLVDDFREQQLPQLLARKTNELADKAHAENNLAQAAKELGATIKTSDLVARTAQVPDIGELATAAPDLFELKVGQISKAINTGHSRHRGQDRRQAGAECGGDRQELRRHARVAPQRKARADVCCLRNLAHGSLPKAGRHPHEQASPNRPAPGVAKLANCI